MHEREHDPFDDDLYEDPVRPSRRRTSVVVAGLLVCGLAIGAVTASAQISPDTAAILLRILTQNVEINGKLGTNNTLTKGYWNWHENDLARGYRLAVPVIDKTVAKLFKSHDIGYVEPELKRIEAMTRDGRIDNLDRDDYELAFSKVPDTPDALGQLAVDANTVHLMVKSGQVYKKLDEYRKEFERLSAEQQVSPYRAEQIAKQLDLLRSKMEVCRAQLDALEASNQAIQTAQANKFLKDDKAAQLQNAGELQRWCDVKPPWMTDGQQESGPPF